MITPSFALTATERVLPKLALDFTTASLDPRVTFTRALATATRVNSAGLIESVAADTPRFDFDPVTLACKGLLIEESRLNNFTLITNFANAYFTKNRVTVSTGAIASTYALINADKLTETATSGTHEVYREVTVTASTANTFSFYVKAAERTWVYANLVHPSVADNRTWFNLSTGAIGTNASGNTGTITNAGNGWWRITLARTTSVGQTSMGCAIGLSTGNNTFTYTGDGTSGLYAYGLQHETGAFATSLITADGTNGNVTRNTDVATMTGTNFSDWFNATEGTFVATAASLTTSAATRSIFDVRSATTIRMSLSNFGTSASFAVVDTTTQASLDGTSSVVANTFFQVAGGYKVDNFGCAANGGVAATDTLGTVPVANVAWIGGINGTSVRNGWISKISYYPQKLTSAELSAFSKQG